MNMKNLIELLDAPNNDYIMLTREELFSIPVDLHYTSEERKGMTCLDLADEQTEPGAYLLWEFNAYNIHNDCPDQYDIRQMLPQDKVELIANRVHRFVELLLSLNISTRYDCFDSYGSQSEDPETAVISQLCFEADLDFMLNYVKPIAVESKLFLPNEFDEYYSLTETEE